MKHIIDPHKHTYTQCILYTVHTHYWCTSVWGKKALWHRQALKSPWLQSHAASCTQRAQEAAGNKYTENQWITHLLRHTHTLRYCWWQSAPFALKMTKLPGSKSSTFLLFEVCFLLLTNTHLKIHLQRRVTRHIPYWLRWHLRYLDLRHITIYFLSLFFVALKAIQNKSEHTDTYSSDKCWSKGSVSEAVRTCEGRFIIPTKKIKAALEPRCCSWRLTDCRVMTHSGQQRVVKIYSERSTLSQLHPDTV